MDSEVRSATLSTAMGYLSSSTGPAAWNHAVARAGQLLASDWADLQRSDDLLATLALALYTLGHEGQQDAERIPLDVVRGAVAESTLPRRIRDASQASGQIASTPGAPTAIQRIIADLDYVWEPIEPMGDDAAAPRSRLQEAQPHLTATLTRLSDEQVARLPAAPTPMGPAHIIVRRHVEVVAFSSATGVVQRIYCHCGRDAGGTVEVDGPLVTYVCAAGHRVAPETLIATRARAALTWLRMRDGTAPAATHTGRLVVDGNLLIARDTMPIGFNPYATPLTAQRPAVALA